MAVYCTQSDMVTLFGSDELIQRTDRNRTGSIDASVLASAIAYASAKIDGSIVAYLPLSSIPPILSPICCDIARYFLYDDNLPDAVEKRYLAAVDYLEKIESGKLTLGLDALGAATVPKAVVSMGGVAGIFGRSVR